ncbi:MAG: rod shape-determining protein RodA [Gammaproteobacteria bacterium]|nr:rod shape-determining protein RodA [Gammaproteobacteria bacterium]MDH3887490.1 rod shape-determining protein RodA [Gammaproteobacteria bacterium]MDH3985773.1 rod shape-determining protein RodA [Gammaproteobacteria bacterium]
MSMILSPHREDASQRGWQYRLHIDVPLLITLVAVSALGLIVLYSAGGGDIELVERQLVRLGIAYTCMLVVAQFPPRLLQRLTPWLFVTGILFLLAVLVGGEASGGAQRWLNLYVVRFQPSEMMKLAVPMMVAWYLADTRLPPNRRQLLAAAILIAVPMLMIARQPDLGTALLIASSGIFVVFLAGLQWRLLAFFSVLVAAAAPLIWHFMRDYQRQRVMTLLNPESDPLGSGYHIIQSKIAIGSGGLFGKGWMNGTQSQLNFLPERSTDFIFAVLGEEFGFFGILLLFAFYTIIVIRGIMISIQAQDTYTRLLAGSVAMTFCVYFIVNTGMVTGVLPVVGLPLPMISYGGTSIVTLMAGFGILMSIQTHRKLLPT